MPALEALTLVGLADRVDHFPSQLSGGEQQRVALARALINEPRLLLADEPTGNLDGDTGADIMDLIFRLQQARGATLFLITHDMRLAERCRHRVRMESGRLREMSTSADLKVEA